MTSSTKTLVEALRILARDIQSNDGVANAVIGESADRLELLESCNADMARIAKERNEALKQIKRLEEAGDDMVKNGWNEPHLAGKWRKAKEEKP